MFRNTVNSIFVQLLQTMEPRIEKYAPPLSLMPLIVINRVPLFIIEHAHRDQTMKAFGEEGTFR